MKKNVFFLLSVFVLSLILLSGCKKDDNYVGGTVSYVDKLDGKEYVASGATVYLMINDNEYAQKVTADNDGNFSFYPVDDGDYHIYAEYSTLFFDYTGKSENFSVKGADNLENMDLTLTNRENSIYGTVSLIKDGQTYIVKNLEVDLYKAGENTVFKKATTNDNGEFVFSGLPDGTYDLDALYTENNTDYYDLKENISVEGGESKEVNLTLTED